MNTTSQTTPDIFSLINEFRSKEYSIDWDQLCGDENKIEDIDQSIHDLVYMTSLSPAIKNEDDRVKYVGLITVINNKLSQLATNENQKAQFISMGKKLEEALRELTNCSSWLEEAKNNYAQYTAFEEQEECTEAITLETFNRYASVIMATAIASILMINDQEEFDFEDEEEDEEDED